MIRLQQLRIDAGLSVKDLAAQAKVGALTIRRIEESGQVAHVAPLHKLAAHFGVEKPSELLHSVTSERAA